METNTNTVDSGNPWRGRRYLYLRGNKIDPHHHLICDIQHEGSVYCDSVLLLFPRKTLGHLRAADPLLRLRDPTLSQPGRHPFPPSPVLHLSN